jgi:hypothetical protein
MRNYQLAMGIFGTAVSKFIAENPRDTRDTVTIVSIAKDAVDAAEAFEAEFYSRPSLPPPGTKNSDVPL